VSISLLKLKQLPDGFTAIKVPDTNDWRADSQIEYWMTIGIGLGGY
jgi:hypothetical protein